MTASDRSRPASDVEAQLAEREAEVTRVVTEAVTADLTRGFEREAAALRDQVDRLEAELEEVHLSLHECREQLGRIRSHPLLRVGRRVRDVVRGRGDTNASDVRPAAR
jgi:hypothetical protein